MRDYILFKKILVIILGSFIYSSGIALFLDPNEIAPGGVVGISVILSHTIGISTGTWYLLLNIPILLLARWKLGRRFIATSMFTIAMNSLFTNLLEVLPPVTNERFLASIAGSILIGLGIGMIIRVGATTGGVDIIVRLLKMRFPGLKTSTLFMMIDMMIVVLSGIVFRNFDIAMYALIAVSVYGKVMDYVLYGNDEATLIFVVSEKAQDLLTRVLDELEVGATILHGQGGYSKADRDILMCVVKKRMTIKVQELVKQEDNNAFMIITSANEIYGEGYKNILNNEI